MGLPVTRYPSAVTWSSRFNHSPSRHTLALGAHSVRGILQSTGPPPDLQAPSLALMDHPLLVVERGRLPRHQGWLPLESAPPRKAGPPSPSRPPSLRLAR